MVQKSGKSTDLGVRRRPVGGAIGEATGRGRAWARRARRSASGIGLPVILNDVVQRHVQGGRHLGSDRLFFRSKRGSVTRGVKGLEENEPRVS